MNMRMLTKKQITPQTSILMSIQKAASYMERTAIPTIPSLVDPKTNWISKPTSSALKNP